MSTGTPSKITVGELAARLFAAHGITHAFGVVSIHNMPVLDAFHRLGSLRFVPARGEAGAVNMADAATRVSGRTALAVTSTGTAAGNACGAMVEALTAGTPLLHLTGQIELPYLDRNLGYIHEARDQLSMLKAVSKAAYRVWRPEDAAGVLKEALRVANTAPCGPVSVEIPIDVQEALIDLPEAAWLAPLPITPQAPEPGPLAALAQKLAQARRPLLWLGGGARGAGAAVARLLALGVGVVTSVQGRGVVAEQHPLTLGAFNLYPEAEAFYATCDAMVVVGSRLRSNETLKYKLKLPKPLYRIDADPQAQGRAYGDALFVCGDATLALTQLADALEAARAQGGFAIDPAFAGDLARARHAAAERVRAGLGPYAALVDELQRAAGDNFVWVRDVTVSNSTWGNRALLLSGPRDGVHAMGGGIGMGAAMSVGAALAATHADSSRKTLCLSGDGGLMLNVGELATLKQENARVVLVVMNDRGYGVIRNIQDAQYGGRRAYVDLVTPDFAQLTGALGIAHMPLKAIADTRAVLARACAVEGPVMVEVDMNAIGPFATAFAGPPVKKPSSSHGTEP